MASIRAQKGKIFEEYGVEGEESVQDGRQLICVPRACTDELCCMVFALFIAGMVGCQYFAQSPDLGNGDIRKLVHGFDWEGNICDVSNATSVQGKPYLYWCATPDPLRGMDISDGICVSHCPTDTSGTHLCPGDPELTRRNIPFDNGEEGHTVAITVSRPLVAKHDIVTREVLGMYCLPQNNTMMNAIVEHAGLDNHLTSFYTALHGMMEAKHFLIGVFVFSIISGYAFLWFMRIFAGPFIKILFFVAVLGSLVLGGASIALAAGQLPDTVHNPLDSFMDANYAMYCTYVIGVVCFLLSTCMCCLYGKASNALEVTIGSIEGATGALTAMPTLLLAPIIQVGLQIAWLGYGIYGLGWIISCGRVVTSNPMDDLVGGGGMSVSGLKRHIEFDSNLYWMCAYWAFGMVWIHEVITALGKFAISHAVVVYEFFGHSKCLPLTRGYVNGICWHLGTLAFGGFVIGVLKILAMIASYISKQNDSGGVGNTVKKAVCCCCLCCLNCLIKLAEMVNEMVYVDVVIEGHDYMPACAAVIKLVATDPLVFGIIAGATAVIKYLGIAVLGVGGTYFCHLLLIHPSIAKDALGHLGAPEGVLATSSVLGATIGAGVICLSISSAFMVVFDSTADTLAYATMYKIHNEWPDVKEPEHWQKVRANAPEQREPLLENKAGRD